ncbi:hypothetical protein AMQ83_03865 [Paenibacillus riograndensis]|nr:hypothetical protein AMQ83_03865 [Paenibacillus riograndensis]
MAESVCKSASTKVRETGRATPQAATTSESCRVFKKALQRGKEGAKSRALDEGQGSCTELGAAAKNPPAYRERHGMKDRAVILTRPSSNTGEIFF